MKCTDAVTLQACVMQLYIDRLAQERPSQHTHKQEPRHKQHEQGRYSATDLTVRACFHECVCRGPVLVKGEVGLCKGNVAALVHFGSPFRASVMVGLDCDRLDSSGVELFGRGAKPGLMSWLGEGDTLLLRNVHKVRRAGVIVPGVVCGSSASKLLSDCRSMCVYSCFVVVIRYKKAVPQDVLMQVSQTRDATHTHTKHVCGISCLAHLHQHIRRDCFLPDYSC